MVYKKLEGKFTPPPAVLIDKYESIDYDRPEGQIDLSRLRVVGMFDNKRCILEDGKWVPAPRNLLQVGSFGLALRLKQAQDDGVDIFPGLEDHRFVIFSETGFGFFNEIWQTSNPYFTKENAKWQLGFKNTRNYGHPTKRCWIALLED